MLARVAILGVALLVHAAPARAQGTALTRLGSGARAAGMANAFVALSDDGTAASWNPGALAQLRKPEFSLVASSIGARFQRDGFRSPDDRFVYGRSRFQYSTTSLEFASLAVPFDLFKRPVTLQGGWRRLYQLSARADMQVTREPSRPGLDVAPALLRLNQSLNGDVDLTSLAGSVRATRRLFVGGSIDFVRSAWEINLAQVETPGRSAPSDFLSLRGAHRLRGHSTTVGMLLSYPAVNVGLVYHFPFWMDYRIDHKLDSNLIPPVRLVAAPGTRMRFPTSYAAGVAWRPNSEWTLAADLTRDEWSRTTVDRLPGQDRPTNFFDELPEDRTSSRDTLTLAVGAERLFRAEGRVIPLRFGFAYEPQGDMNAVTRDPVNLLLVSAGGGFNTNQLKLDMAFQLRWASSRQAATLGVSNAIEGVYDAVGVTYQREWRIKFSAIYRIADTDKLRGLVKRVFVGS